MESITLKNIANISSFSAELKNVVVFYGESIISKDTISKLIALFRNWEFQGKLLDYNDLFKRFSISPVLNKYSRIEYESSMRKITFNGEYFEVTSKISKTEENIREEEIFRKQVIDVLQEALIESDKSNKHEYLYEKLSKLKINVDKIIVIPAQRSLIAAFSDTYNLLKGSQLPLPNHLIDFKNKFYRALEDNSLLQLEHLNIDVRYTKANLLTINGIEEKLSDCAAYLQSIISMFIVLDFYSKINQKNQKSSLKDIRKLSYLIEEPELHIHKNMYQDVIKQTFNYIDINTSSVIINTNCDNMANEIAAYIPESKLFQFSTVTN